MGNFVTIKTVMYAHEVELNALGGVKIQVHEQDVENAIKVLKE